MKEKVLECALKKYGEKLPLNVQNRLDYEWSIILKYHLENDLLILAEIMKKWRNLGYFVHGDGCLKESFIMYLLGIIDVNPMCLNKLFELDFQKRQFDIIVPQEIQSKFDENLKDEDVHISIHYLNWFRVNLLSKLEGACGIKTCNISFDEENVLNEFMKKESIGYRYTIVDFLEAAYGLVCPFGIDQEELVTFYDYINYDKNQNDEYSIDILVSYYITYFKIHFPNICYPIYVDYLIKSFACNIHYQENDKMQFLTKQIINIYNKGYSLEKLKLSFESSSIK